MPEDDQRRLMASQVFGRLTKNEARILRHRFRACAEQWSAEDEAIVLRLGRWLDDIARPDPN